jgi:hypothetical protein
MRIAYFINQYPKVSHSFIRREMLVCAGQVSRVAGAADLLVAKSRRWQDGVDRIQMSEYK